MRDFAAGVIWVTIMTVIMGSVAMGLRYDFSITRCITVLLISFAVAAFADWRSRLARRQELPLVTQPKSE